MQENFYGKYKLVLGLEIHLEPTTKRKMFCRCSADIFGKEPNTHTCPTCLGLPGALPVPNLEAIKKTQLLGLALNSKLATNSRFDRKQYFYPDLPKGYQISQYKHPLCLGGYIELEDGYKAEIERIHLEEDTAKSSHEGQDTLIDFNMSSMPLIEIVTKPVFKTIEQASEFARIVQHTVSDLGIGEVNMEKGQMRLEPNISLRTAEMEEKGELPGYKVEIKNINSFKFMEKAIKAEVIRQRELLDKGETPIQENRGYIESSQTTVSQRSKEDAHDYRYFPEPDIPPMVFDKQYLSDLAIDYQKLLAQTPTVVKIKLLSSFKLPKDLLKRLIDNLALEELANMVKAAKELDITRLANDFLNSKQVRAMSLNELKEFYSERADKITDSSELISIVKNVIKENQDAVENYLGGKESALQFLIGMVMRETKGKADVTVVNDILIKEIKK